MKKRIVFLTAFLASTTAHAQSTTSLSTTPTAAVSTAMAQPQVSVIPSTISGSAVLRTGTEVALKLSEELTTKGKRLKVGQHFRLETYENVLVNGVAVIPVGTTAVGEITEVRNKGMWGKSGHFTGQLLYMSVNGRQIRLTGTFDDKGTAGGVGAVAVSAIVFLPAGFFMTGTSAQLPIGTPVKGFVGEDVQLAFAAQEQAPLTVSGSAPMPVTAVPAASFVAPNAAAPAAKP